MSAAYTPVMCRYTHLHVSVYIYIRILYTQNYMVPLPRPTFLCFLLVFAVNYAHFELIFLVAVLGHVLVDLWGVPYTYIYINNRIPITM